MEHQSQDLHVVLSVFDYRIADTGLVLTFASELTFAEDTRIEIRFSSATPKSLISQLCGQLYGQCIPYCSAAGYRSIRVKQITAEMNSRSPKRKGIQ